ncbi:MAG: hypothetical protein MUC85_00470 [Anaerolineales bacterium]|jgi:hypothetical protein|nr:hypothetical protein [Anaerolineales bacterium]
MSDESLEKTEKQDASNEQTDDKLTPTGVSAMQGNDPEIERYQREQEKYIEDLYDYRTKMQEQGNTKAVDEADDEIKFANRRLYEAVQQKHGIKPSGE